MPNPNITAGASSMFRTQSLHRQCLRPLAVGLLLAATVPGLAQEASTFHATVRTHVDADGEIVEVQSMGERLHPALARAAETFVQTLRFAVPTRAGQAVGGQTFINLGGCMVEHGGDVRVAFRYLDNGPWLQTQPSAGGMRRLLDAWLSVGGTRLEAQVTADVGTDGGVTPVDVSYAVNPRDRRRMDTALQQMVRQMRYDPEQVDGMAVATQVKIPVVMTMESDFGTRASRREEAAKAAAAVRDEQACVAAATGDPTRAVAVDSPFRPLLAAE